MLIVLVIVIADLAYLSTVWPDWARVARGPVPKSNFILGYEVRRAEDKTLSPLRWQPVTLSRIAPVMQRAVVVSEDSRFWFHDGIDPEAIRDALEYNVGRGRVAYGASTISQQTAKNLFLSRSRDPLRKWHELVLTLAMEREVKKSRILEIYLNVAEFGEGVFGVEAAAQHYFGIPASQLDGEQAVALAATLPSPRLHNPRTATRTFLHRKQKIARHMAHAR